MHNKNEGPNSPGLGFELQVRLGWALLAGIYINKGQRLRLDESCADNGTILHELMHTLGFRHEQSRTDRDDFFEIIFKNIAAIDGALI